MTRRAPLLKTSFGSTDTVQENSWNLLETTKWLEMHSHGSNNGITAFSERREAKREQKMLMKMLFKTNIVGRMKKYWLFATFRTTTFKYLPSGSSTFGTSWSRQNNLSPCIGQTSGIRGVGNQCEVGQTFTMYLLPTAIGTHAIIVIHVLVQLLTIEYDPL